MQLSGSRILVVGPSQPGDGAWYVARELRLLGARVSTIDQRRLVRLRLPGVPGKVIERTGLGPRFAETTLNKRLAEIGRRSHLMIAIKGEHLDPEVVARLDCPTINWYVDHPMIDQVFQSVGAYTFFCPKDRWSAERLTAMGFENVRVLPHASAPDLLRGDFPAKPAVDIAVVGSSYPYRQYWIERAATLGFEVGLWGDGNRHAPPAVSSHHPKWVVGARHGQVLRLASLVLNTHTPRDIAGGNQRLHDSAAAGCAQLTEDLPESHRAYGGSEVMTFSSAQAFDRSLDMIRDAPEQLRRMGAAALERCWDEHRYRHRLATIASWF